MRALALIAALLSATLAHAQTYAFRGGPGVQMTTGASRPTTIAGRRTLWVDSSNRLRFYNGTDDTYPAAVAATTKGDLAAYTGSAWSRLAAGSNGLCLVTDSGEATGLKWAACAASTGYQTVQDEATPLTQRTTINFTGAGVSCVDNAGSSRTDCTISGGGSSTLAATYSNGASQTDSTIGLDSTRLGIRIRDNATPISGSLFAIQNSAGSVNILSATKTGTTLGQVGQTSGTASAALKVALASHTGQTASTERVGVDIDLSATNQWATGAITTQRDMVVRGPTYSFVGASTVTDGATFAVTGAPFAGTNATITNAWSVWVQDGATLLQNNSVGSTLGYTGLQLENRVSAGAGNQKYSPAIVLSGNGWKTNATAGSQSVKFALQTVPVQGAASPTGGLSIQSNINGAGWNEVLNVGTTSTLYTPAVSSDATTAFGIAVPASTGITASTEKINVDINLGNTQQHATGALTTQRAMVIRAPQYSFVGASTITDAATLAITSSPFAGTNATLTNSWALWTMAGPSLLQDNFAGATVGYAGLVLENRTAATSGNQKYSSALIWSGNGWKTNATAGSQPVQMLAQLIPVQGAANPSVGLSFQSNINAGGWNEVLNIGSASITASVPIAGNLGATTVAPTWTAITYSNSWVDYGASATSRYSKNANGQVTLEIRCKNGSSPTAAINSATPIAAGYRPSQVTQICGQTLAGGIACGDLGTDGIFTPSVSSTAGIFLRAQYFAEN